MKRILLMLPLLLLCAPCPAHAQSTTPSEEITRIYLESIRDDVAEIKVSIKEMTDKIDGQKDKQAETNVKIERLDSNQQMIFKIGAFAISMSFLAVISVFLPYILSRKRGNEGRAVFKEDINKWIDERIEGKRRVCDEDTRN